MKLYETFGASGFHSTIVTTFGVDFEAFENIALSRLRSAGSRNNILIVDRGMLDQALAGASSLPEAAGRLYSVIGANAQGVFHSKLILQLGRKRARLLIGSANATAAGIAGNLELMGRIDCGPEDGLEAEIIRKAWGHLEARVDETNRTVLHQLHWAQARSAWLFAQNPIPEVAAATNRPEIDFMASSDSDSILDRFVRKIGTEEISELVILSPFWDADLRALSELTERLQPNETVLLIDPSNALFPGHALDGLEGVRLVDIGEFAQERFVHAKFILARSKSVDHLLFGSANCTAAALGHAGKTGTNDECCLYRRLPPGELLFHLKLADLLENDEQIEVIDLPEFGAHKDLPEEVQSCPHPGRFEYVFGKLLWHPLASTPNDQVSVELLDSAGNALDGTIVQVSPSSDSIIQFELQGFESTPTFARLAFQDGVMSAPAIVMFFDDLREEVRETSRKGSKYIPQLLAGEAEEGLWLLEALSDLEELEAQQKQDLEKIRHVRKHVSDKSTATKTQAFKTLGYSDFINGRKLKPAKLSSGRNSLAGSEVSIIREYLNRLLAVGISPSAEETDKSEADMDALFNQGDSVFDPGASIECGKDFSQPIKDPLEKRLRSRPESPKEKRLSERRTTRNQIDHAVDQFRSIMKSRILSKSLTSIDLLRLRAMLTVLAAAGFEGRYFGDSSAKLTSLQVLPVNNVDEDWSHMVGQVLFMFFGGSHPSVFCLQIEDIYDQIPDDIYECWLMCVWIACACLSIDLHSRKTRASLEGILKRIYAHSGLTPGDLVSDSTELFLTSLNERFANRLGIDGDRVVSIHESRVRQLFGLAD